MQRCFQVIMVTPLYFGQDQALFAVPLPAAGRSRPMGAYMSVCNTCHPGGYTRVRNKDL